MAIHRIGEAALQLEESPSVLSFAEVVGRKERQGPLGACFKRVQACGIHPTGSFEEEERRLVKTAFADCLIGQERPDVVFGGDLLNQCVSTSFAMREQPVPYIGLYGACSTMAEGLAVASVFVSSGSAKRAVAVASSHFCTAERQYRLPLNYGSQRPQTAQWTVTAAGAVMLGQKKDGFPKVTHVSFGRVVDYGIRDANNMGAAMAPAAAETLLHFFEDTKTMPEMYDRIFTGDLGLEGGDLLRILMEKEGMPLGKNYNDCGALIFDGETQDTHAGGSGCGCSAAVLSGYILPKIKSGAWQKVLFMATGALLSPTTTLQGESIPGIAHLVAFSADTTG